MTATGRRGVLVRSMLVPITLIALAVCLFVDVPWWVPWALDAVIWTNCAFAVRAWHVSKRRANAAGLRLVDVLCEAACATHRAAGDHDVQYCTGCAPGTTWPCPIYLEAMAMSTETSKHKLRFLRRGVEPVLFGRGL